MQHYIRRCLCNVHDMHNLYLHFCLTLSSQDVPDVASRLFAFIECASLDNCIGADVLSRLPSAFVSKLDPAVVASNIVVQAAVRQ